MSDVTGTPLKPTPNMLPNFFKRPLEYVFDTNVRQSDVFFNLSLLATKG